MPLTFVKSQKGKNLLLLNGYLHNIHQKYDEKIVWRCTDYKNVLCKGRCHTTTDSESGEIIKKTDHCHSPNIAQVEAKKVVNSMKETAANEQKNTRNIISENLVDVPVPVIGQLPTTKALSRIIQRTRVIKENPPINPSHVNDLIIPDLFKYTKNNELFLTYDNENNENRILIFSTQCNLIELQKSDNWFGDGTFKSVPTIFSQLYTIHCHKNESVLPLVYVLMTDRTKDSYTEVLDQLLKCKPDLDPKSIQIDFEQAFISAFQDIFPNAKINGCFFHFCQCVWRKIQSLGLQKTYSEDSTFALQVKQLCALAFVPVHDVVYAFEELIESEYYIENESLFQPILNYFEDTWIGRPVRRKRRSPLFPLNIWNVYENVLMKLPRTNNAIEGWHNAFNSSIGVHHTTIWKFINFIKTEQNLVEAKIEKINLGESHASKRKKYKDLDQRIENVVLNYQRGDILNYLKGIAHNFNF